MSAYGRRVVFLRSPAGDDPLTSGLGLTEGGCRSRRRWGQETCGCSSTPPARPEPTPRSQPRSPPATTKRRAAASGSWTSRPSWSPPAADGDRHPPTATPRPREVLLAVAATRPWLDATISESRLVADIARGYDAVVMGADKWAQVHDPAWYGGSPAARDTAIAQLPRVLIAPRSSHPLSPSQVAPAEALSIDTMEVATT